MQNIFSSAVESSLNSSLTGWLDKVLLTAIDAGKNTAKPSSGDFGQKAQDDEDDEDE